MAGKVRHLVNRSGRYHARVVVPQHLRSFFNNKWELRTPLGGDYRQALKLLPGAVANHQREIADAERMYAQQTGRNITPDPRYILTPQQIAHSHYTQRLAFDDELRNDRRYANVGIDDDLVSRLRNAVAGRADDAELSELVGYQVERFRAAGNLAAEIGSDEWRVIARALCSAELEALERVAERDEGDFTGTPSAPIIRDAQPPQDTPEPVSIKRLWADYVAMRKQAGSMKDGGKRLTTVIESLRKFLKHDDAAKITRKDVIAWRDDLLKSKSATTVSTVYLSTVRSLLQWAFENERLSENVAATVKQSKQKRVVTREKGYTDTEAVKVLKASRSYKPNEDAWGRVREKPQLVAAKRWVPIICAFTGARVTEITQLRKEDVRQIATYVDMSLQLVEDSANVLTEVTGALSEDFGQKEALSFVNGSATTEPSGFMQDADIESTSNGHATALDADALIAMMYSLPGTYRNAGTFVMNGATLATIRTLKDNNGNYLWQPSYQAGQPETILGRPVVEAVDMPDIADGAEPIIFGDFKRGYRIYDRLSLALLADNFTMQTVGKIRYHARRRVGAGVVRPTAFRKLLMAA